MTGAIQNSNGTDTANALAAIATPTIVGKAYFRTKSLMGHLPSSRR
jgi:hypothetical protein